MRLEQLHMILEISKSGSMSQAAKNLALSQPSLSAAVAALEKELGLKLFNRSSKGVVATPSGQNVLEIAQHFDQQLNHIKQQIPNADQHIEKIQIITIPSACSSILTEAITHFKRIYPNVQITITQRRPSQLYDLLLKTPDAIGIMGYNFMFGNHFQQLEANSDLVAAFLYHDRFHHLTGIDHPLAKQSQVSLDDIYHYPLIYFSNPADDPYAAHWEQFYIDMGLYLPSSKIAPPSLISATSLEMVRRLLVEGVGTTLLPKTALYRDIYMEAGLIKVLDIPDLHLIFDHYLIHHRQLKMTPAAQTLITILKHVYHQLPTE